MPVGKAIARSVSIRGATEKRVRKPSNIDEQRLERADRARPHAAAGRGIERVSTKILNGPETQGIDRCLGDNQSWKRRTLQRQSKERLYAPRQRAFVSRVDSDVRCNPVDSIGSSTESRVSHSEPPPRSEEHTSELQSLV